MVLDGRGAGRWASASAPVVVEHTYEAARQLLLAVRRQDRALAQLIEASAAELRRSNDLLDARRLLRRTERLRHLSQEFPSTVVAVVRDYASLVQEETADLSIPTPHKHLTAPLADAYVHPNIAVRRADQLTLHPDEDLLELVREHPRLLVFGEPGGGKSTTVQACVNALARSAAEDDTLAAVPIRVTLRHVGRKLAEDPQAGLFQWILGDLQENYLPELSSATLSYLLHTGKAVVFFDGLDEVLSVDLRRELVKKIWLFARGFPACNYVVTTREPGYDEAPFPASAVFTDATIQPLTLDQMKPMPCGSLRTCRRRLTRTSASSTSWSTPRWWPTSALTH
jgi:hypothetical protein